MLWAPQGPPCDEPKIVGVLGIVNGKCGEFGQSLVAQRSAGRGIRRTVKTCRKPLRSQGSRQYCGRDVGHREMERCFTAEQQAAGRAPRASSKHSGRPAGMRVHYHVKVGEDQQKQRLSRSPAITCDLWESTTYQRAGVSLGSPFEQKLSRLGARRCNSTNRRKPDSDPPLTRAGSLTKEQSTWNEPSEAAAGRRQSVHRSPCGSLPCSLPRLPRWPRNRLSSCVRP